MEQLNPPERMATYTFNKNVIQHHFFPTWGIILLAKVPIRKTMHWLPTSWLSWSVTGVDESADLAYASKANSTKTKQAPCVSTWRRSNGFDP